MTWSIEFVNEMEKDMKELDHSAQIQVLRISETLVKIHYLQRKVEENVCRNIR